ncbi:hypothetical protein X975_01930, partial [Stegodyphus mimosarum]
MGHRFVIKVSSRMMARHFSSASHILLLVRRALQEMGPLEPMNIFLRLEMDRMNKVITTVCSDL